MYKNKYEKIYVNLDFVFQLLNSYQKHNHYLLVQYKQYQHIDNHSPCRKQLP